MPIDTNTLEVELKFELSPRDVKALGAAPPFKAMQSAPARRKTLRATYFDTPDLALSKRGISLRVRKESRHFVQCVKASTDSLAGGGFARHEWEWAVKGADLDPALLKSEADVKALFKGISSKKIRPLFSTEITRQTRQLITPGGAHVQCDIDHGRIVCGDREAPIYELELELRSGNQAELFALARLVTSIVPARLSTRTKAHRGFTLYLNQGHTWQRGEVLVLDQSARADDVLHAAMSAGLKQILRNEDCVLTRCDAEGVHQMRVALRRMRSLLSTYKKHLDAPSVAALDEALKAAASALGPARDWDVFVDELLPPVLDGFARQADKAGLLALRTQGEQARDAGYRTAEALIRSPDYARLLSDVLCWVGNRAWGDDARMGQPAKSVARDVLARHHRRVLKAGQGLAQQPADERHRLRIAVKKARYAAEVFRSLYPSKKTAAYLRALRALQDGLGHLNDLSTAQQMMAELVQSAGKNEAQALAHASGLVEGWYAHAQAARERALLTAWKGFTKAKAFW